MPVSTPAPARFMNQINRHIERTVGPISMVFHEIIASDVRLDLHIVPPQGATATDDHPHGRNFFTLVTSGLSAMPMTLPPGAPADTSRHVELMLSLPADWPGLRENGTLIQEYMAQERNWWPIRWLKLLARLPHDQDALLRAGDVIPSTPEAAPYCPGTRLGAMLLRGSALHPHARQLVAHDDLAIEFLALWPIYPEEMEHREHGAASLEQKLDAAGVTDLVDMRRASVIP